MLYKQESGKNNSAHFNDCPPTNMPSKTVLIHLDSITVHAQERMCANKQALTKISNCNE